MRKPSRDEVAQELYRIEAATAREQRGAQMQSPFEHWPAEAEERLVRDVIAATKTLEAREPDPRVLFARINALAAERDQLAGQVKMWRNLATEARAAEWEIGQQRWWWDRMEWIGAFAAGVFVALAVLLIAGWR